MIEDHNNSPQLECLNCNASAEGSFCHNCGQKIRENSDRSISHLLGEVLGNIFFLDNRFINSAWYLVRYPARMTVEFLEGKRKKFISPVTLFLFVNLIYFFASILSDYSISLEDQFSQPYSRWIRESVTQKMRNNGLSLAEYDIIYQKASDNISKAIMIINIPMIAGFVYLQSFKKRSFYYDSLIFCFHFFSLFMASWIMLAWLYTCAELIGLPDSSIVYDITFYLFAFLIPLLYAILSIKRFLDTRWYWAILAGMGVMIGVTMANLIYRFIILVLTLWAT